MRIVLRVRRQFYLKWFDRFFSLFGPPKSSNPSLEAIAEMKKSGPKFFVCRQYLAAEKIAAQSPRPDVPLAADALLVLIHYENQR
jgi:intracellular sulfur oxidation DsrE/DsrF family protein